MHEKRFLKCKAIESRQKQYHITAVVGHSFIVVWVSSCHLYLSYEHPMQQSPSAHASLLSSLLLQDRHAEQDNDQRTLRTLVRSFPYLSVCVSDS